MLSKTAGLQEALVEKEEQLGKARKELVSLRKEGQALESQLSACNATIQKISQEKAVLENNMGSAQGKGENRGATGQNQAGAGATGQAIDRP